MRDHVMEALPPGDVVASANVVIQIRFEASDIECLIDTAGYGINYWAKAAVVRDLSYTVDYWLDTDKEPSPERVNKSYARRLITPQDWANAWAQILNDPDSVDVGVGSMVYKYLSTFDLGDVDSIAADALVQVICFGKVLFG